MVSPCGRVKFQPRDKPPGAPTRARCRMQNDGRRNACPCDAAGARVAPHRQPATIAISIRFYAERANRCQQECACGSRSSSHLTHRGKDFALFRSESSPPAATPLRLENAEDFAPARQNPATKIASLHKFRRCKLPGAPPPAGHNARRSPLASCLVLPTAAKFRVRLPGSPGAAERLPRSLRIIPCAHCRAG